ncbi:MAG: alpha/beta hydrolase [Burkholderiales bacterium]|nr:alpha/beta hydrolase [Burkholderiales bacterium]
MHETTLAFGPDHGLIGTLTLPAAHLDASAAACGMVLFNAGVVHRVGPHRINVKLARELARHGIPTIRFDLHGMGDSLGADGQLNYQQQVVRDLQAAMDTLQAATRVPHFTLLGFCSGALPSYWTAQQDARVRHIILHDVFFLQTLRSRWRFIAIRLRSHGFKPTAFMLYLRRAVSFLGWLSLGLMRRLQRLQADAAAPVGDRPTKAQLIPGLTQLAQRGVQVSVVQSGADFSNVNYDAQIVEAFGLDDAPIPGLRTDWLAPIDHIMTSINAQRAFIDWICADVLKRQSAALDLAPDRAHHVPPGADPAHVSN